MTAFALYLLFAGTFAATELWTAAALALFVAGWTQVVRRCTRRRFTATAAHLGPWRRSLGGLLPATARTGWALAGVVVGRAVPAASGFRFVHGHDDDPAAAGRRATAVLAASLAPDSFVVRLPPHGDRVVIHHVAATATIPDERWLA